MKQKTWRFVDFLLVTTVAVYSAAFAASAYAAPSDLAAQINRDGGVTVTVTPRNLSAGASSWDFEVVLETHTQPLDQDLTKVAVLIDVQGKSQAPLAWEGSPPGGHHRRGLLRFQPLTGNPPTAELRLHGIGAIETRVFRWQLR